MPATTTDAESPPSARQVASPAAVPVLRETAAARSTRLSHAALLAATVEEVVAEWLQRIGAAAGSVSASAAGARRESLVALGAAEEEPGGGGFSQRVCRWRPQRVIGGAGRGGGGARSPAVKGGGNSSGKREDAGKGEQTKQ